MKFIYLLLLSIITFSSSKKLEEPYTLAGVWELDAYEEDEFSSWTRQPCFWMKFSGDSVLISDSNNAMIYMAGLSWRYEKGRWTMVDNVLTINIEEYGAISTNTYLSSLCRPQDKNASCLEKVIKFALTERNDDRIELTLLEECINNIPETDIWDEERLRNYNSYPLLPRACFVIKKGADMYCWPEVM